MCENRPCNQGLQCSETDYPPYYACNPCPPGYTSEDGFTCIDIDECYALQPCDPRVRCTNLSPGFKCDACPAGYSGEGFQLTSIDGQSFHRQVCEDIDECRERSAKCGPNTRCVNTDGSYTCACLTGYMVSNSSNGCVPIPGVCADGVTICDKNANCRSLGGRRYGCKCKVGFAGDGFICGSDRDLDGWPDQDLKCSHPLCRQDNCPTVPVIARFRFEFH
jgi:thrombospondin 2/3/4/5